MRFFGADRSNHLVGRYCFSFIAASWWIPATVAAVISGPEVEEQCDPLLLIELVESSSAEVGDLLVVMTDYGPRMLFETELNVLSIPNHRYQPGFRATYEIMNAKGEEEQRRLLAEFDVEYMAICPSEAEAEFFDTGRESLRQQLIDGARPLWLTEILLPGRASNETDSGPSFLLFEVSKAELG